MNLEYKKETNKDYLIQEVYIKLNTSNYVELITKKELNKLKKNTLLQILSKLTK